MLDFHFPLDSFSVPFEDSFWRICERRLPIHIANIFTNGLVKSHCRQIQAALWLTEVSHFDSGTQSSNISTGSTSSAPALVNFKALSGVLPFYPLSFTSGWDIFPHPFVRLWINTFIFPPMLLCSADGLQEHQQVFPWKSWNALKDTPTLMCTKNTLPQKNITSSAETTTCITNWFHHILLVKSEGRYFLLCVWTRFNIMRSRYRIENRDAIKNQRIIKQ